MERTTMPEEIIPNPMENDFKAATLLLEEWKWFCFRYDARPARQRKRPALTA